MRRHTVKCYLLAQTVLAQTVPILCWRHLSRPRPRLRKRARPPAQPDAVGPDELGGRHKGERRATLELALSMLTEFTAEYHEEHGLEHTSTPRSERRRPRRVRLGGRALCASAPSVRVDEGGAVITPHPALIGVIIYEITNNVSRSRPQHSWGKPTWVWWPRMEQRVW